MMDNVEVLKQMKAELLQRVDAIDYAIRVLETSIPAATPEPENALDMSKIPPWGGSSGGIRLDD